MSNAFDNFYKSGQVLTFTKQVQQIVSKNKISTIIAKLMSFCNLYLSKFILGLRIILDTRQKSKIGSFN